MAYALGGLVVAVGGSSDPATNGGGFLGLLTGHGAILTIIAVFFVFANLGSVGTHCLYNGAVGWSGITKTTMRPVAVILGILGAAVALTGVWSHFVDWLNLLGIFVPPLGLAWTSQPHLKVRVSGKISGVTHSDAIRVACWA